MLPPIPQEPNHRECNPHTRGRVPPRAAAPRGATGLSAVRDDAGPLPQLAPAHGGAPGPRPADVPGAVAGQVRLRQPGLLAEVLHPTEPGRRPACPDLAAAPADRGRAVPPRQGGLARRRGGPADPLPHRDRQVRRAALAPAAPGAGPPPAGAAAVLGGTVHRRGLRPGRWQAPADLHLRRSDRRADGPHPGRAGRCRQLGRGHAASAGLGGEPTGDRLGPLGSLSRRLAPDLAAGRAPAMLVPRHAVDDPQAERAAQAPRRDAAGRPTRGTEPPALPPAGLPGEADQIERAAAGRPGPGLGAGPRDHRRGGAPAPQRPAGGAEQQHQPRRGPRGSTPCAPAGRSASAPGAGDRASRCPSRRPTTRPRAPPTSRRTSGRSWPSSCATSRR